MSGNKKPTFQPGTIGKPKSGSSKVHKALVKHQQGIDRTNASNRRSQAAKEMEYKKYIDFIAQRLMSKVKRVQDHPSGYEDDEDSGLGEQEWYDFVIQSKKEVDANRAKHRMRTHEMKKAELMKIVDDYYDRIITAWESVHEQTAEGVWQPIMSSLYIQKAQVGDDGKVVVNEKGNVMGVQIPRSVNNQLWIPGCGEKLGKNLADRVACSLHGGNWGELYAGPIGDCRNPIKVARFGRNGELSKNDDNLVRFLEGLGTDTNNVSVKSHTVKNRRGENSRTFVLVDLKDCPFGDQLAGLLINIVGETTNLKGGKMYNISYWEEKDESEKSVPSPRPKAPKGNRAPSMFGGLPVEGDEDNSDEDDDDAEDAAASDVDDSLFAVETRENDPEVEVGEAAAAAAAADEPVDDVDNLTPVKQNISYASRAAAPPPPPPSVPEVPFPEVEVVKKGGKKGRKTMNFQQKKKGHGPARMTLGNIATVHVVDE